MEESDFNDFDFEEDLSINPDELDIAALEQANLAFKYSKASAYYDKAAKKAWEFAKTVKARLIKEANENPVGCLGEEIKPTAANVEAYYRDHPDYLNAKEAQIQAEYERDIVKGAADHIAYQRKNMITVLAQLLQNEYFASPRVPRDLKQEWDGRRKDRQKSGEKAASAALEGKKSRRRSRA